MTGEQTPALKVAAKKITDEALIKAMRNNEKANRLEREELVQEAADKRAKATSGTSIGTDLPDDFSPELHPDIDSLLKAIFTKPENWQYDTKLEDVKKITDGLKAAMGSELNFHSTLDKNLSFNDKAEKIKSFLHKLTTDYSYEGKYGRHTFTSKADANVAYDVTPNSVTYSGSKEFGPAEARKMVQDFVANDKSMQNCDRLEFGENTTYEQTVLIVNAIEEFNDNNPNKIVLEHSFESRNNPLSKERRTEVKTNKAWDDFVADYPLENDLPVEKLSNAGEQGHDKPVAGSPQGPNNNSTAVAKDKQLTLVEGQELQSGLKSTQPEKVIIPADFEATSEPETDKRQAGKIERKVATKDGIISRDIYDRQQANKALEAKHLQKIEDSEASRQWRIANELKVEEDGLRPDGRISPKDFDRITSTINDKAVPRVDENGIIPLNCKHDNKTTTYLYLALNDYNLANGTDYSFSEELEHPDPQAITNWANARIASSNQAINFPDAIDDKNVIASPVKNVPSNNISALTKPFVTDVINRVGVFTNATSTALVPVENSVSEQLQSQLQTRETIFVKPNGGASVGGTPDFSTESSLVPSMLVLPHPPFNGHAGTYGDSNVGAMVASGATPNTTTTTKSETKYLPAPV